MELIRSVCALSINQGEKGLVGGCCCPAPAHVSFLRSTSTVSDNTDPKSAMLSFRVKFTWESTHASL